ncbi:MAG: hypothetical protein GX928_02820, partial [Ruminococcaceae bacterium]|nr:hypothetical protein [Oscillospiraceae bacterium]
MSYFIDYLGNKSSILDFIEDGINEYLYEGDTILDLFAGSGVVANRLSKKYNIIANDVEPYSSTLCSAILSPLVLTQQDITNIKNQIIAENSFLIEHEDAINLLNQEQKYINLEDIRKLDNIYKKHETVWNSKRITPAKLREKNQYNLFFRYYAGTYFGL